MNTVGGIAGCNEVPAGKSKDKEALAGKDKCKGSVDGVLASKCKGKDKEVFGSKDKCTSKTCEVLAGKGKRKDDEVLVGKGKGKGEEVPAGKVEVVPAGKGEVVPAGKVYEKVSAFPSGKGDGKMHWNCTFDALPPLLHKAWLGKSSEIRAGKLWSKVSTPGVRVRPPVRAGAFWWASRAPPKRKPPKPYVCGGPSVMPSVAGRNFRNIILHAYQYNLSSVVFNSYVSHLMSILGIYV